MDTRTPEDFAEAWILQADQTLRLVLLFDDTDLALVPGPGAMSLHQQLAHLVAAASFTADLLRMECPTRDGFGRVPCFQSVLEAARGLFRSSRDVRSAALAVPSDWWDEPLAVLGSEWTRPRRELAFLMLDHAIHHTGALHVYARMAGKVPPKLYQAVEPSLLAGLE